MKGKTLLLLALALSMALVYVAPLANASPTSMEIIFNDTGTSTYDPCPLPVGAKFGVTLHVTDVPADPGCVQWMVRISWDPAVLNITKKPTQGPWLSQDGTLSTGFLVKPMNITGGKIPEMTCGLMEAGTTSGSGDMAYMEFQIMSPGSSWITIYGSKLYDPLGGGIDHDIVNGWFNKPIPGPTAPKAVITEPTDGTYIYVCSNVTLDGRNSLPGFDSLPLPGHSTPITDWAWYITGTITMELHGDYIPNAFHCNAPGDVWINLTVYAPDMISPTHADYKPYGSIKIVIHQIEKPVGPAIDVYTERGGQMPGVPSDAYGPQELVIIYAKVTYNDDPVQNKLVAFEVKDPSMTVVVTRTAPTDTNGIATTDFRIPWPCTNATGLFGNWTIYASVDIAQTKVDDTCKFQFGWLIQILSVKTTNELGDPQTSFKKCHWVYFVITIKNIRKISLPVTITIVIYDNCNVPIGIVSITMMVPPGESEVTVIVGIHVVKWAFIGLSTVYVNAYTKMPQLCGVPYCPEVPATITLEKA
jgi:hypothetical protein